ncbi:hypothetical protein [Paraburkholderia sp. EG304]|uniref:hypothetical protein n=1 Tax=Paraburkholderia sp. EG304 TaxID=3237015 RepID=UPI00397AC269
MVTEIFKAKDEDGNIYQVVAYRTVIRNADPPIYSTPEFRLADGRRLTPVGDGNRTFEILLTGIVIKLI